MNDGWRRSQRAAAAPLSVWCWRGRSTETSTATSLMTSRTVEDWKLRSKLSVPCATRYPVVLGSGAAGRRGSELVDEVVEDPRRGREQDQEADLEHGGAPQA